MRTSFSDLKQHLTETWLGIQQSVINQAIDQWRVCLNACVKAKTLKVSAMVVEQLWYVYWLLYCKKNLVHKKGVLTVLLQIHSGNCLQKKIWHTRSQLDKVIATNKGAIFYVPQCIKFAIKQTVIFYFIATSVQVSIATTNNTYHIHLLIKPPASVLIPVIYFTVIIIRLHNTQRLRTMFTDNDWPMNSHTSHR